MPHAKRLDYLNRKLRAIVQHAYKHSVAFKNKMEAVGLKSKDIQTIKDLEKIPITKKADLVELQKKNPPFGGFEAVSIRNAEKDLCFSRSHPGARRG